MYNIKEELDSLSDDTKELYSRKTIFESKLKDILTDVKSVRLINMDNDFFTIYLKYENVREDINEIAESLGYIVEQTFKNKESCMYRLIKKNRIG